MTNDRGVWVVGYRTFIEREERQGEVERQLVHTAQELEEMIKKFSESDHRFLNYETENRQLLWSGDSAKFYLEKGWI